MRLGLRSSRGERLLLVALLTVAGCARQGETLPSFYRWGKVEIIVKGPFMKAAGEPNPFDVVLDIMFTGPDGTGFLAPAFYDGDGRGGLDGNIWRVRFSADQSGIWSWRTQSAEASLNGLRGRFTVLDPPPDAPDLFRLGRLEYTGERYLKFRDGGYWIKAGAGEPKNLLGGAFGRDDWGGEKEAARRSGLHRHQFDLRDDPQPGWGRPGCLALAGPHAGGGHGQRESFRRPAPGPMGGTAGIRPVDRVGDPPRS